jgi:hypothetical protein
MNLRDGTEELLDPDGVEYESTHTSERRCFELPAM